MYMCAKCAQHADTLHTPLYSVQTYLTKYLEFVTPAHARIHTHTHTHTIVIYSQALRSTRIVEICNPQDMAHKQKPGADIGSLQQLGQTWRAYAKGRPCVYAIAKHKRRSTCRSDKGKTRRNLFNRCGTRTCSSAQKKLAAKIDSLQKRHTNFSTAQTEACCQD